MTPLQGDDRARDRLRHTEGRKRQELDGRFRFRCRLSASRVFLLELDRQGTLSDWNENRKTESGPDFERIDAAALEKALSVLRAEGYDLVVIDTPGVESPAINAAMRASDLCLIPCRPTAPDLRGCLPTVQSLIRLERVRSHAMSAAFTARR